MDTTWPQKTIEEFIEAHRYTLYEKRLGKPEIMRAGAKAFADGLLITDNPYKYTDCEVFSPVMCWQNGWCMAEIIADRVKEKV